MAEQSAKEFYTESVFRNSFDNRIDDDLCEVILSFLPIKDKLRYESVSKRFQRLIFNKQKHLSLSYAFDTYVELNVEELVKVGGIDLSVILVLVFKKFPNINSIECPDYYYNALDAITFFCHNLTAIEGQSKRSDKLNRLFQKFGQKLKYIWMPSNGISPDIRDFPELISISNQTVGQLNKHNLSEKLVKIHALCLENEEEFQLFSNKTLLNLKYLDMKLKLYSNPNYRSIEQLSELKNLVVLKIHVSEISDDSDVWQRLIKSIAINCTHLESFEITFNCNRKQIRVKECMESLSHMTRLKKLCFSVFDCEELIDLAPLKNCKRLLCLRLEFGVLRTWEGLKAIYLTDKVVNGIDLIVPQLIKLELFVPDISDKALKSIEKLRHLTHLVISCSPLWALATEGVSDKSIQTFIENWNRCKYLRIHQIKGLNDIRIG